MLSPITCRNRSMSPEFSRRSYPRRTVTISVITCWLLCCISGNICPVYGPLSYLCIHLILIPFLFFFLFFLKKIESKICSSACKQQGFCRNCTYFYFNSRHLKFIYSIRHTPLSQPGYSYLIYFFNTTEQKLGGVGIWTHDLPMGYPMF